MAATAKRYQKVVRDTAANLSVSNRIYPLGWKIIESDTDKWKESDGLLAFNSLPYLPENLTNKFNPGQVYEYLQAVGDTRLSIKERSDSLFWMHLLGINIIYESVLAGLGDAFGMTLQSNYNRGTWVFIDQPTSVSELLFYIKTAGVYTATGNNQLALYSYNTATRIATKVASTANNGNLYKTAGLNRVSLTASYNALAGLYLVVSSFENSAVTTSPVILGRNLDTSAVATVDGHRMAFTLGASMPTTIDMSTVIAYSGIIWFGVA